MDIDYDRCFDETELWEGGFSDVPGDPGGATMRGLTQSSYDAYRRSKGFPMQPIHRVTSAEIEDIFKNEYWAPARCDALFVGLDMVQFDEAINSGPPRATMLLQDALGLDPDGWFGLETLGKVQGLSAPGQRALIQGVCAKRVAYWKSLAGERKFLPGWLSRGKDVEAKALAMLDRSAGSLGADAKRDGSGYEKGASTILENERRAQFWETVARPAEALPDVATTRGLQTALKMLGCRITVDGDYGPETRQAITSFQMHAGIVADGVVGAQTEARLTKELNELHRTETAIV